MSSVYAPYRDEQPSGAPSPNKNFMSDDQLTIKLRISPWTNNALINQRQNAPSNNEDLVKMDQRPANLKCSDDTSTSQSIGQPYPRDASSAPQQTPSQPDFQASQRGALTPKPLEISTPASQGRNSAADSGPSQFLDQDDNNQQKSKKSRNRKLKRSTTRNKMRVGKEDGFVGEDGAHDAGYIAARNIWKTVESYFLDFNEEDLKFCTIQTLNSCEEYFTIPPLGTKKPADNKPGQNNDTVLNSSTKLGTTSETDVNCNFTSRLISALIEELTFTPPILQLLNVIPRSDSKQPPYTHVHDHPFGVFSAQELDFVEQRVKKELVALDLFKDNASPCPPEAQNPKEQAAELPLETDEDDVVKELKRLQAELKSQILVNNEIKEKLRKTVEASSESRRKAREEKDALSKQENFYVQQLKQIMKNKKKKMGKTPSRSDEDG
ncbi:uncharacterized protein LOC126323273 [Schistocerca gregaria]|uniref:uncharacterized protein LOC126323273 n=1 Tax=Schistocerca gregaria TaxID=7010 RepID=UPI00211EBCB8|nr:uncharacterized protein LOC126323273 [Schistocerca gregaria]